MTRYGRRGAYRSREIEVTRDEARERQRQHEARQLQRLAMACDRFFQVRGIRRGRCSGHIVVTS
jgi:hypothetical protein